MEFSVGLWAGLGSGKKRLIGIEGTWRENDFIYIKCRIRAEVRLCCFLVTSVSL